MKIRFKYLFLAVAFIFPASSLFCQSNSRTYKNQLNLSPVRLIDLVNPGVELGYELFHSDRFSSQLSVAYLKEFIDLGAYDDFEGYRISLEEKWFPERVDKNIPYISGELVYYSTTFRDESRFGYKTPWSEPLADSYNYTDSYSADKKMIMLNLKLGYQIIVKRIVFDFSAGLGVKYKDIDHGDRLVPSDKMERPRHPNAYYYATVEGERVTVNIPINIKVGWAF